MKVLIGTPCFGGKVYDGYVISLVKTLNGFWRDGIQFAVYTLGNEALINRARNKIANYALQRKEIDKLVFIDADMSWNYPDFQKLIESDKLVIGGTCPMKTLPIAMCLNVLAKHQKYFSKRKSFAEFKKFREDCADSKGEVEVHHIGNAFMSIDRKALEKIAAEGNVPQYDKSNLFGEQELIHEFFPVSVQDNFLESEDYGFLRLCRQVEIDVWLNANVVVRHSGTFTWDAEMETGVSFPMEPKNG